MDITLLALKKIGGSEPEIKVIPKKLRKLHLKIFCILKPGILEILIIAVKSVSELMFHDRNLVSVPRLIYPLSSAEFYLGE
jgi:hypothetical protein